MFTAYKKFWQLARSSEGRSTRADYWWVFLVNSLIRLVLVFLSVIFMTVAILASDPSNDLTSNPEKMQAAVTKIMTHPTVGMISLQILGALFSLAIMWPVTTLTVRRLRDAGRNPSLAYPLPAIYLANIIFTFVTLPAWSFLSSAFTAYTLVLLVFCLRKSVTEVEEKI
jgi:uncharacterized membrane protein YhaH (DUF805 family)